MCQGITVPSRSMVSKPQCVYDYLEMFWRSRFYFMYLNIYKVKWTAHWVLWSHIIFQVLMLLDVLKQMIHGFFPESLVETHCEASLSWGGVANGMLKAWK